MFQILINNDNYYYFCIGIKFEWKRERGVVRDDERAPRMQKSSMKKNVKRLQQNLVALPFVFQFETYLK